MEEKPLFMQNEELRESKILKFKIKNREKENSKLKISPEIKNKTKIVMNKKLIFKSNENFNENPENFKENPENLKGNPENPKDTKNEPINTFEIAYKKGYESLNDFQKDIIRECITRRKSGLSLPMGSGKTLISLVLSLYQNMEEQNPFIVVCAKSLIASWVGEIEKFFQESLHFQILHSDMMKDFNNWTVNEDIHMILTTPDVLSKFYKENNIQQLFIKPTWVYNNYVNFYQQPLKPFLNHTLGGSILFSKRWGSIIIDEAQKYTKIDTQRCQAISSICANHRWALSGTLFDEPIPERILGYFMMLDLDGIARNLPDIKWLLKSATFNGLNSTVVARERNVVFQPPKINERIISHTLSIEEGLVYSMMKQILKQIRLRVEHAKLTENKEEIKKFSSYLLVMIGYLRQALVCPLIPLASIAITASDMEKRSELSKIIMNEINQLHISDWMNDPASVQSSRIKEVIKVVKKHPNEKIIIFSCYKSCLDILEAYMPTDRKKLRILANMNINRRGEIVEELGRTDNGILICTYELGAEGLNLQCANTVLLLDFWWNAAKIQQAIARVVRFGQIAKEINVYFFSSNTGIENALFSKQKAKLQILNELKDGCMQTKIPTLKMDEIIKLIELNDNTKLINDIEFIKK